MDSDQNSGAFARAEGEVDRLQTEIVGQAKQIEEFITEHAKSHGQSSAFRSLTTLYELFKSVVAMNFELRRGFVEATEKAETQGTQIDDFLQTVSEHSKEPIPDLNTAALITLNYVEDRKVWQHHARIARKSLNSIKALEKERFELQAQIDAKNRLLRTQESKFSAEISKISSRTDSIDRQKSALKSELLTVRKQNQALNDKCQEASAVVNEKRATISRLKSEMRQLTNSHKTEVSDYIGRIRDSEEECSILRQENDRLKITSNEAYDTIRNLQRELSQVKSKLTPEGTTEGSQIKELEEAQQTMAEEHKQIETKMRQRISKLKAQRDAAREQITQQKATEQASAAKMANLRSRVQELEIAHQDLVEKVQRASIEQARSSVGKVKNLESQIDKLKLELAAKSHENVGLTDRIQSDSRYIERLESENVKLRALHPRESLSSDDESMEAEKDSPFPIDFQTEMKSIELEIQSLKSLVSDPRK
jgi:chromosome segregation ATPase